MTIQQNDEDKRIADAPISWVSFQAIMSDFGYEMVKNVTEQSGIIFRLKPEENTEGKKNPITVIYPDFFMSDRQTPAYERDYVIDLLNYTLSVVEGDVVARIIAKRQSH